MLFDKFRMCDVENLIQSVESHPCIWNVNDAGYHDRDTKESAWENVCSVMIQNWDDLEEHEKQSKYADLKKKWNNIRDYYRKDKQKVVSGPTGSTVKKQKRYIYANMLTFLDTVFEKKPTDGNSYPINVEFDNSVMEEQADAPSDSEDYPIMSQHSNTEVPKRSTIESKRITIDTKRSNFEHKRSMIEARRHNSSEPKKQKLDVMEKILQVFQTMVDSRKDDDDEHFLLSFLADMKMMNHKQKIDFKFRMLKSLKDTFQDPGDSS